MLATVRRRPAWGMQIRREIETCTEREIAIGAVYSTLDRLESKGFVTSRREAVDGRTRRLFEVTRDGIAALEDTRRMRDALWQGLDLGGELAG